MKILRDNCTQNVQKVLKRYKLQTFLKIIVADVSLTTSDASSVDNIWMRCVYGQMGTGQRHSFESEY